VSGIIAAPKNDSGMHGVSYNASVVNFKIANSSGVIYLTDSQEADLSTKAASADAWISNNSWGSSTAITSVSEATIRASFPLAVTAYQAYVADGGVVVFSAGNNYRTQPSWRSGLPYRISGLESGWLAVMSVDLDGDEPWYTNRCGVAKAWCLAAPGGGDDQGSDGIYSMYNDGDYARLSGTSMAAPMVSGAIAGLKSMFPNLSYHDIRERLLTTANGSGQYANEDIFGQGLMDLDAASSPVGGLSLPTSRNASGGSVELSSSQITLPSNVASKIRQQRVLVLDNYQKAPFYISASKLIKKNTAQFNSSLRNLARLSTPLEDNIALKKGFSLSSISGIQNSVGLEYGAYRSSFSSGFNAQQPMMRLLGFAYSPHLNNSAIATNNIGTSIRIGGFKMGIIGSVPHTQGNYRMIGPTGINQMMDGRNAYSVVTQVDRGGWSVGGNYTRATDFNQPLGITATGDAFKINNTKADAVGVFFKRTFSEDRSEIKASVEHSSFSLNSSGFFSLDHGTYSVLRVDAHHFISAATVLTLGLRRERAITGTLGIKLPSSIDADGDISYQNYAIGLGSVIESDVVSFDLHHRFSPKQRLRVGLTYESKPSDKNSTGTGMYFERVF
jgi:hypothetical protein